MKQAASKRRALALWPLAVAAMVGPVQAGGVDCRLLQEQRDQTFRQAMGHEIALVQRYRERHCPQLARLAEQANASSLTAPASFPTIDYAAWSECRRVAEADLERTLRVRYRSSGTGFRYYSPQGAALAREADRQSEARQRAGCR
ncbi:MAG: hypothetical protein ACK55H_00290 [Cyanobacteriota bacterium]|jgi:hypothetical protein